MLRFVLVFAVVLTSLQVSSQTDGGNSNCCDPDAPLVGGTFTPGACNGQFYLQDGINCDPDCGPTDGGCTAIPIDGGLSLLALAGGGLATAAMRRRREEEATQEVV